MSNVALDIKEINWFSIFDQTTKENSWSSIFEQTLNAKQDYSHHVIFTMKGNESSKMELFLTGRTLFITGFLGSAIFKFEEEVTVPFLEKLSIETFVRAAVAYDRKRYIFNQKKAIEEIENFFISNLMLENIKELEEQLEEHQNLYEELVKIVYLNSESANFSFDVFSLFSENQSDILRRNEAYEISNFGRTFSDEMLAYFIATQMI